jgi:zinc and cadmium transporter|nr:ZIP family metal transporter [Kofleriaceae bacterium]
MVWLYVAIAVALDGAAGLAGALLPEAWLERHRAPMLGFAAGALVATGCGDVLPDAVARGGAIVLIYAAAAAGVLAIVEAATSRRAHHRRRPVAPVALLASDALHNVGDGMAIAAAFLVSPRAGIATAAAVIIHEVPEELADYALLRASNVGRGRALAALTGVQLTAAIGAAGTLAASQLVARGEALALALAGGTFLYIAVVDIVPELVRRRSLAAVVAAVAGAAVVLVTA